MSQIIPNSKPKMTRTEVSSQLSVFRLDSYPVKLLGIRGYYKTTMGNPVKNDRGIYDDAIFIVSEDMFASFNANTDPSVYRQGIATLKAGNVYMYRIGMHNMEKPYEALRQHGRVTVIRDGGVEETDTAARPFWINIHKGGYNTTSSLGCQTIYPTQWLSFLESLKDQLKRYSQRDIPYALINAD